MSAARAFEGLLAEADVDGDGQFTKAEVRLPS
jgi:hypothetical protein